MGWKRIWRLGLGVVVLTPRLATGQQATLDGLVAEGMAANRKIRSADRGVEAARAGVTAAGAARWPTVTLTARYSELQGAIPNIGTLVNPAFSALNELLGRTAFPTDLNLQFPQKQETAIRVVQPLFNPAVGAGRLVARSALAAEVAGQSVERHAVAADIRRAYLGYLKARSLAALADSTAVLVAENVRVNEALVAAGKSTPDAVLRARADQAEVAQRQLDAGRLVDAARQRVNFLVDRPLDAPLEVVEDRALGIGIRGSAPEAVASAVGQRPELAQAEAGLGVARGQLKLARADAMPALAVALDYGIQGDKYRLAANRDFAIGSMVLSWKLFSGGQLGARKRAASLQVERQQLEAEQVARAVTLEVTTAHAAAVAGERSLGVAGARLASALRSYELMRRRYGEGLAAPLELLDARTAYTAAAINAVLTQYEFFERCVELDRAAAWYPVGDGPQGVSQ